MMTVLCLQQQSCQGSHHGLRRVLLSKGQAVGCVHSILDNYPEAGVCGTDLVAMQGVCCRAILYHISKCYVGKFSYPCEVLILT